jgi:hypothetical protein
MGRGETAPGKSESGREPPPGVLDEGSSIASQGDPDALEPGDRRRPGRAQPRPDPVKPVSGRLD